MKKAKRNPFLVDFTTTLDAAECRRRLSTVGKSRSRTYHQRIYLRGDGRFTLERVILPPRWLRWRTREYKEDAYVIQFEGRLEPVQAGTRVRGEFARPRLWDAVKQPLTFAAWEALGLIVFTVLFVVGRSPESGLTFGVVAFGIGGMAFLWAALNIRTTRSEFVQFSDWLYETLYVPEEQSDETENQIEDTEPDQSYVTWG